MVAQASPLQEIISAKISKYELTVLMKRDDLLHPKIMGNKWRKLKYNLIEAKNQGCKTLLTFGGAYSNHIAATATAANEFGFESIGIIRGDELHKDSNATLRQAADEGMNFRFVSRNDFRLIKEDLAFAKSQFPEAYILPEGGTNGLAIKGAAEIISEIDVDYDYIFCPIGTGGTMAGLLKSIPHNKQLLGISSLKGSFIHQSCKNLFVENSLIGTNYQIFENYHFGGYGKVTDELIAFINDFKKTHQIALDPIYTGKMVFAFYDLMHQGFFHKSARIILLHTGGLQGVTGFNDKHGKILL